MSKDQIDKETKKILTEGEKLKRLTESEGWAIVRDRLYKKAAKLLNMQDITEPNPQFIINLIGIRQETAKNLVEWLREIEGDVEQHKGNNGFFVEEKVNQYILHM